MIWATELSLWSLWSYIHLTFSSECATLQWEEGRGHLYLIFKSDVVSFCARFHSPQRYSVILRSFLSADDRSLIKCVRRKIQYASGNDPAILAAWSPSTWNPLWTLSSHWVWRFLFRSVFLGCRSRWWAALMSVVKLYATPEENRSILPLCVRAGRSGETERSCTAIAARIANFELC